MINITTSYLIVFKLFISSIIIEIIKIIKHKMYLKIQKYYSRYVYELNFIMKKDILQIFNFYYLFIKNKFLLKKKRIFKLNTL